MYIDNSADFLFANVNAAIKPVTSEILLNNIKFMICLLICYYSNFFAVNVS